MTGEWKHKILNVTDAGFPELALEVFRYQYKNCGVYRAYVNAIGIDAKKIKSPEHIPFLPIRFFKSHEIKTGSFVAETVFESSGTTGTINSRHFIKSVGWYEQVFTKNFQQFYGNTENWCIIGLLPSYLERKNSSLVHMVNRLVEKTENLHSGFYMYDFDQLAEVLFELEKNNQPVLLLGVSFALLDFAERKKLSLRNAVIMETGGMKGRRQELIRDEMHRVLKDSFGVSTIHSEYGMTELISQAYSKGEGIFNCPPWMKMLVRDDEDPFAVNTQGSGAINIIDLGNIYSCSFIATDDVGKIYPDGGFEILGRMDGSDLRGCSLLAL
jgi:phenylacetate-coenzyme A ligase PaaK-like adenylate-forming protein